MFKGIKSRWMAFKSIFKDKNDYNEKSIVGFLSFTIMVLFAFADIITGLMGEPLEISNTIFNSFVIVTLGAFGISEIGKILVKSPKVGIEEDKEPTPPSHHTPHYPTRDECEMEEYRKRHYIK